MNVSESSLHMPQLSALQETKPQKEKKNIEMLMEAKMTNQSTMDNIP